MEKGETGAMPKLWHHLWHDRINMEFAEACMQAMFWHQDMGGRFNEYLDSEAYRANADRAIKAYFRNNPLLLGLYKAFPEMFLEKVKQLSYYANLGLFWEVMAPVFFEMSDLYDEGKLTSVQQAMEFLVNGIFAVAGQPIYHQVQIAGEWFEIVPKAEGMTWLHEAALPYVEAVFYRGFPFRGTKSYNAQVHQIPDKQADFHYGILYADIFPVGSAGIPPTLLMQDMLHFLPPYLEADYAVHRRGDNDKLIQLGVTFQRSMYNVTSAVLQALRAVLHHPLDDPDPDHLLANRRFFEEQMDRFLRPEARLDAIQDPNYR
jgi:CO2 hydration protein